MPEGTSTAVPLKRWSLPWILSCGGYLPAEGAETYAMSLGGVLQSVAGGFGSSLPGKKNAVARKSAIAACIGGIFLWNYFGGDPSVLMGMGRERFDRINQKQAKEIANGGQKGFWKRLSLNGTFRRSSMQAVLGAVTGGSAWAVWALGSAYAGPKQEIVRPASLIAMLLLTAGCGWSMSHDCRKRVMGLDDAGNVI